MRTKKTIALLSGILIFVIFGACGPLAPTEGPALSDEDVAATVNAAVEATNVAEANLAATVDAAVEATKAAEATSSAEAAPTATNTLVIQEPPTAVLVEEPPTPAPVEAPPTPTVDTSTLSEEELAALTDKAVAEAVAATTAAATAMDAAASDSTITLDETVTVEVALAGAEEAIALAEALLVAYYDIYGAYASESISTLEEIEDDLNTIAEGVELMIQMVEQGSEVATAAIEQIQAAVGAANVSAAEIQAQAGGWQEALRAERENRTAAALAVQPTEVAADRQAAIQSALTYVETVRSSLADNIISGEELSAISLAGANASAGLKAQGGPQLQNLAGSIDAMTTQIARGELPQAKGNLGALEASVPRRP